MADSGAELRCGDWRSGPVQVAEGFWERLLGIHGAPPGSGVLIPGRSVHGMFIIRRLWAVGLDRTLRVVGVRMLRPGGLAVFWDGAAVLELRSHHPPPHPGWTLSWKGGRSLWPGP